MPNTMKTLAIVSRKGGAGKTTISTHLAVAAEALGIVSALFDLDPQASAAIWADHRGESFPAVMPAQYPRLASLLKQAPSGSRACHSRHAAGGRHYSQRRRRACRRDPYSLPPLRARSGRYRGLGADCPRRRQVAVRRHQRGPHSGDRGRGDARRPPRRWCRGCAYRAASPQGVLRAHAGRPNGNQTSQRQGRRGKSALCCCGFVRKLACYIENKLPS